MVLKQLGYNQKHSTDIHIDNISSLTIIDDNTSPTKQIQHMHIRYFAIQDWHEDGDIIMKHIPGMINPSNNLTKPLGYIFHACHYCHIMGHDT